MGFGKKLGTSKKNSNHHGKKKTWLSGGGKGTRKSVVVSKCQTRLGLKRGP